MQWMIKVTETKSDWAVRVLDTVSNADATDAEGRPFLEAPRNLRSIETKKLGKFPLPPLQEVPEGVDEVTQLLAGQQPELLEKYYRSIVSRGMGRAEMKVFGKYLFLTLIGKALWQQLLDAAAGSEVALNLAWDPKLRELTRLPWEMMHDEKDFLMARDLVTLARKVLGTKCEARALSIPPRVMFVIGSNPAGKTFDGLKPGAEYIAMVRELRLNAIGMTERVLLGATPNRIETAVKTFRPDVVHFICHGDSDGSLELVDDSDPENVVKLPPEDIYRRLHPDGLGSDYEGPQIVALGACYSAGDPNSALYSSGQSNFPLAIELVCKGVPIVVGMAGEISDQACRLFGKRFFSSLLENGDVATATARGRREGLKDPQVAAGIDWTLPTLFFSESLPSAKLLVRKNPAEGAWHGFAEFFKMPDFPGYYARLSLLQAFEELMFDRQVQIDLTRRSVDLQVLGIWTEKPEEKFGRSSALRHLAAKAARCGSFPILVTEGQKGKEPKTAEEVVRRIKVLSNRFLGDLKLDNLANWKNTDGALNAVPGQVATFPKATPVGEKFGSIRTEDDRLDMLAFALYLDLLGILDGVRRRTGPAWLDPADVFDLAGMINRLRAGEANSLCHHIWSNFSDAARETLLDSAVGLSRKKRTLIEALNSRIEEDLIYNPKWYAAGELPEDVARAQTSNPRGVDLYRANRMLLMASFPSELKDNFKPSKLILLVDDIHRMGDGGAFLLQRLFTDFGFRSESSRRDDIRVVFTYCQTEEHAGEKTSVAAIADYFGAAPWADSFHLLPFREPTERQLACENLLLSWREGGDSSKKRLPLVLAREHKELVNYFLKIFDKKVQGNPSLFSNSYETIDTYASQPPPSPLKIANDDDP